LDEDGADIGHITDLLFHGDGSKTIVVSESNLPHFVERLNVLPNKELLIPTNYIKKIDLHNIKLRVKRSELTESAHIALYKLINRDLGSIQKVYTEISSRYLYFVYEVSLTKLDKELQKRNDKIETTLQELTIKEYNSSLAKHTSDFITIFNEIAMTSVDAYETMTKETLETHFTEGCFLAYRFGKPVGYVISSIKESDDGNIAAIAGIGIHHNARRKGLSTAFLKFVVDWLKTKDEYESLQADILASNEASIGLFSNLGFEKIDEFHLY
jgi:ribosomal protein S18 acetylase RimI-like enzyme